MANIAPTKQDSGPHLVTWVWSGLTQADAAGEPVAKMFGQYVDRSVQIQGTFDGATAIVEGSNDGTNYHPLTDPQGNAISKTSAALEQITEMTLFMRPRVTGAGASTNLEFTLATRKESAR